MYDMEDLLLQTGPLAGLVLLGVLALATISRKVIGATTRTLPQPNYHHEARTKAERVHGYHDLADHEQTFLCEWAADFLQRGYELNTKINRLEVTTSHGPRACLTVTEEGDIEMLAYVESDGWNRIEVAGTDTSGSELKAKQRRLNQLL
jgi:hypothetical protein